MSVCVRELERDREREKERKRGRERDIRRALRLKMWRKKMQEIFANRQSGDAIRLNSPVCV